MMRTVGTMAISAATNTCSVRGGSVRSAKKYATIIGTVSLASSDG